MCHAGPGQQLALPVLMNDADLGVVIGLMEAPQQAQCGTADAWKMRSDRSGINRNVHTATAARALSPEREEQATPNDRLGEPVADIP
jgi:hypothetical protein